MVLDLLQLLSCSCCLKHATNCCPFNRLDPSCYCCVILHVSSITGTLLWIPRPSSRHTMNTRVLGLAKTLLSASPATLLIGLASCERLPVQALQVNFQPATPIRAVHSPVLIHQLWVSCNVVAALPVLQQVQLLQGLNDVLRHHHGAVTDVLHADVTTTVSQHIQYLQSTGGTIRRQLTSVQGASCTTLFSCHISAYQSHKGASMQMQTAAVVAHSMPYLSCPIAAEADCP